MEEESQTIVTALVLYSEKDRGFRSRFEAYMGLLEKEHYVDGFEFLPLEDVKRTEMETLAGKADVFLLVATTSLTVHPFCESETFRHIKALHKRGQRLIVPIHYRRTAHYEKVFSSIPPIPTNGKPVMDQHWSSPEDALLEIYAGLKTMCFEYRKAKDQLERAWETAQRQQNANAYRHFLQQHPYSKYEQQARVNIQQLTEANLWRNARNKDAVDAYYDYLTDSPLKAHRFEAADAIQQLENNPERNWQEIREKDKLPLYLDYYLRSPGGKHAREAKQKIDERLAQPLASMKGQDLQTQKNSLELMAYEKLSPPEIFTMNAQTRYSDQMKRRLAGVLRHRQSSQMLHGAILLIVFLAELYLVNKLYEPRIDQYGYIDQPNTRLLQGIAIIILNAWLLLRAYVYFDHLQRDISFLQRARYVMQSLSILLRVAFVSGDQDSKDTILKFFTRIDQKVGQIERKNILSYLTQSGKQEPEVLLSVENEIK